MRRRGIPEIGAAGPAVGALAVVGGGPSIAGQVDRLKDWPGEIWAINDTWAWCADNGIDAAFYTIDPRYIIAPEVAHRIERAVLGDICDPSLFSALSHAELEMVRLGEDGIPTASTSMASSLLIAAHRGHKSVTLFGGDCSFGEQTHVNKDEHDRGEFLWISCGGKEFKTAPHFMVQAEFLSWAARLLSRGFLSVEGDGLLPALVEHGDYQVTHVSRALNERLARNQGATNV